MVDDGKWMRRALDHAQRGLGRTAPNPVVGACVVTGDGIAVGDGAHERVGGPHAEVHALEEAGDRARGATIYCTLEPCVHKGRTGPCTDRIVAAGIVRVVAAMEDPYPLVQGRGFAELRARGLTVDIGVEREAAVRLNQPFITAMREGRPFVILKAATSLDGFLSGAPGQRTALTSRASIRHAHAMRAQVDAVAVGSGTVLADDPQLTVREVFRDRALTRVVFDRRLRTPATARLLGTLDAGPVILLTSLEASRLEPARVATLEEAGATVVPVEGPRISTALRHLVARDIHSLVLEGGGGVHAAAWSEGVVDYLQVYVAPVVLGGRGARVPDGRGFSTASLSETRITLLGPDVLIEGYVHRPH